jgi:hypothetical protein
MSPSLGCQAIELPTGHRVRRPHGTTDSHSPGPCGRRRVPEARRQRDRCLGPWCFETKPTPSSSLEASLLSSMPASKDGSKSWAKDIFDPRVTRKGSIIRAIRLEYSSSMPCCFRSQVTTRIAIGARLVLLDQRTLCSACKGSYCAYQGLLASLPLTRLLPFLFTCNSVTVFGGIHHASAGRRRQNLGEHRLIAEPTAFRGCGM